MSPSQTTFQLYGSKRSDYADAVRCQFERLLQRQKSSEGSDVFRIMQRASSGYQKSVLLDAGPLHTPIIVGLGGSRCDALCQSMEAIYDQITESFKSKSLCFTKY
jgi:hypothetical protein